MVAVLTVDLRRLEKAPVKVRGEIASDDPGWQGTGVELVGPLAVEARAEGSASRGVWVRGSYSGRVQAVCRRCLGSLELDVAEDFGLLFDPKTAEGEGDLTVYALDSEADELDLRRPLRELFLMAAPRYPLCDEDCPGLCPVCGANLSEGACGCEVQGPDQRWGPLQRLRGRA